MIPLMSQSLDRRLNPFEQLKLKVHLMICAWCTRYLRHIKLVSRALEIGGEECEVLSFTLSDEARERIRTSLKDRSAKE